MNCRRIVKVALIGLLPVLYGCAFWGPRPLPEGDPEREWRAGWVLNTQDDIRNEASARLLVEEARSLGINTLYVVALYQGQAYYPSQIAPPFSPPGTTSPLTYDPLQTILDEAHHGKGPRLNVYAWVSLCNVWTSRDLIPPEHVEKYYPNWITEHYDVNRAPDAIPEKWLDPGVPWVQKFSADVCQEIVEKYNVDGIILDSMHYRPGGFGYNPIALRRFQEETGRSDRPLPGDSQWTDWRVQQVDQLIAQSTYAIRWHSPKTAVAIVANADGGLPPDFKQSTAYAQAGQNWPEWLREGMCDILVLGSFKRQSNTEQAREFREWIQYAASRRAEKALVVGLAARDNTLFATQNQVDIARSFGAQGVAFLRFRENNSEGRPRKALFEHLKMSVFASNAAVPKIPWLKEPRTGIVAGKVRSQQGLPMSNVRVHFATLQRETTTHANGMYVLFDVPAGARVTPRAYWAGGLFAADDEIIVRPGRIHTADLMIRQ